MELITGDILSRNPGTGTSIVIVNPVSWVPGRSTPFNDQVNQTFPKVVQARQDFLDVLGEQARGDVCLMPCLDSHGYIIASVFCIGHGGICVRDLRKGLDYLAARLPNDVYRFPERMGLSDMSPGTEAFINSAIGHAMWANGVRTQFWHWKANDLRAIEQFTAMRRVWMEASSRETDMLSDPGILARCHMMWLAFCIRNRLVPDTEAYKETMSKLCAHCGHLNIIAVPYGTEYGTLYELMTDDVPQSYPDDLYTPANSVDDIAFLRDFIDKVGANRAPEHRDAVLICALLTAYFYEHGIHGGHPDYGIIMDSVMSGIQARKDLYKLYRDRRMWTENLTYHLPDTRTLRHIQLIS